ncbi:hypothetical protein AMQ68_09830 [Chryseobacterium sp. ERMR1:04]|nr:hypothetical protein AMQ68_09830 [Chryseobacterium sp. ERMR1:04]
MPDLGRWGVVDALAEQMRRFSPWICKYNFTLISLTRFTFKIKKSLYSIYFIFKPNKKAQFRRIKL